MRCWPGEHVRAENEREGCDGSSRSGRGFFRFGFRDGRGIANAILAGDQHQIVDTRDGILGEWKVTAEPIPQEPMACPFCKTGKLVQKADAHITRNVLKIEAERYTPKGRVPYALYCAVVEEGKGAVSDFWDDFIACDGCGEFGSAKYFGERQTAAA